MSAGSGTLNVNVDSPPYCTVYIDGNSIGHTPISNYSLAAGAHALRVSKDSTWVDYTESINVPGGGSITRNISFLPSNIRRIHGHVYDMTMAPLFNAKVTLQSMSVYTDLTGWYDMRNPPMVSGPITATYSFWSDTLMITSPSSGGLHIDFLVH